MIPRVNESEGVLCSDGGVAASNTFHMKLCTQCLSEPRLPYSNSYGRNCRNDYMRRNRPKYSELTVEERKKTVCRSYTKVLVKRGTLVKQPCVSCGQTGADAHHPDYTQPRLVIWFCPECHRSYHNSQGVAA